MSGQGRETASYFTQERGQNTRPLVSMRIEPPSPTTKAAYWRRVKELFQSFGEFPCHRKGVTTHAEWPLNRSTHDPLGYASAPRSTKASRSQVRVEARFSLSHSTWALISRFRHRVRHLLLMDWRLLFQRLRFRKELWEIVHGLALPPML